jgi:tellurite resistance protein
MDHKRFYKELGKLLYAVAAADGKIHPNEVAKIRQVVREEVVPVESSHDQFGTDNAYYAEFEFEMLSDRDFPAADAYHSFTQYLKEYQGKIDAEMKKLCLDAAVKVAEATHGINKSESAYLSDLKKQLA